MITIALQSARGGYSFALRSIIGHPDPAATVSRRPSASCACCARVDSRNARFAGHVTSATTRDIIGQLLRGGSEHKCVFAR